MKKSYLIAVVIIAIIAVAAFTLFGYYNSFVTASESVDAQWAQVESQYQRRFDLIPNLVESVKGIMEQEQEVFGAIAEARTRYAGATTVDEKAEAASEVESALARLLVVMENYPQLRSADTVQTLMAQLEGTENRIAVERNRYNDQVRAYETMRKRFPGNVIAGMFGFDEKSYFEAAAGTDVAPSVEF